MRYVFLAIAVAGSGGAAQAEIPTLNATCPGDIELHVDAGGYAYINGNEAEVTMYDPETFDATLGSTTVSVMVNPDGTATILYTAADGANGICQVEDFSVMTEGCPENVSEADRAEYPACN